MLTKCVDLLSNMQPSNTYSCCCYKLNSNNVRIHNLVLPNLCKEETHTQFGTYRNLNAAHNLHGSWMCIHILITKNLSTTHWLVVDVVEFFSFYTSIECFVVIWFVMTKERSKEKHRTRYSPPAGHRLPHARMHAFFICMFSLSCIFSFHFIE